MRTIQVLTLLAALSPAAAAEQAQTPPPVPRLTLEPCTLADVAGEARCGTYEVYEDRAAGKGRKIPLKVVVLPATGEDPAPDPLFYFAGGPGGSSVEEAPFVSYVLADARRDRDFVFVDVRGTGGSNPLWCPYQLQGMAVEEALEEFLPVDQMASCRKELEKDADLTQYTTPIVVDDVDEVRVALGYERINLYGTSGGTRIALVYLRRHPEVVRTVMLEGVVPLDARMPTTFAHDAQAALDGILAECAADPACHRAFPDPEADLQAALARLRKAPVHVPVTDLESGGERTLEMSPHVFVQTVRYMLYRPTSAVQLPANLHRAAAGDFASFAQLAYTVAGGILTATTDGAFLSVTCSEDVAFIDEAAAEKAAAGTFLGDFRLRQQVAACEHWVRSPLPPGYHEPVRSATPVLLLSGERDPVTPSRWGEEVARYLPASRHIVVPDGAHNSLGLGGVECLSRLQSEFLHRGSTKGLDVEACLASIERPPFLLEVAEEEEIALGPEELRRFVGSYQPEEGTPILTVTLEDGDLKGQITGQTARLAPVAPLRFKVVGAPGIYIEFRQEGETVVGATLLQGGNPTFTMERNQ